MKRVLIIGSPGAGKSTLARKLEKKTHLPLVYLDLIWHKPDGSHISREEFDQKLSEILNQDAWTIDGNYSRTLKMRIDACDTVIYLDYPTDLCLRSIHERIGRDRIDLPWTEKKLDPEFEAYVRKFEKEKAPEIRKALRYAKTHQKNVIEFQNRAQADQWLESLPDRNQNDQKLPVSEEQKK